MAGDDLTLAPLAVRTADVSSGRGSAVATTDVVPCPSAS